MIKTIHKISAILLIALSSCATLTLEDHVKLTTSLADFSIAKHLCVEEDSESKKIAYVDAVEVCIKYNKQKLKHVAWRWGVDAVKGIWLHEVGHVKQIRDGKFNNMHTFTHVDLKRLEIEADEYAGCQMKRQQLDHTDFMDYMKSTYLPDSKHGSLEQRIEAIQRGYERCK